MFLDRLKPALRLAIKTAFIKNDSVNISVKMMKAATKTAFSLMKTKAGDQICRPARKMPAITRLVRLARVKQELINS